MGVKFVVFGFDSFFSNFFELFYIEIVKLGTNFDDSAKNCPNLQKMVRTKAQKNISFDLALQGHPERVLKVNHVAGVFIFTKNQFSQLFLQEK